MHTAQAGSPAGDGGTRGTVREGLRRLVRAAGPPPAEDAVPAGARTRWRNRLLDLVGSDARPLADLLLRVEAHGLVAAIPAGPLGAAAWGPVRARLAFGYAAETFLDADMARWAVDAWAYALGAIEHAGLYVAPPVVSPVAPVPAMLVSSAARAGGAAAVPAPAVTASGTPAYGTPAHGAAAYAPPGPAFGAARPGKIPGRVRRAIARANAPPAPNPFPKNFDRIAGLTFMGMVTAAAVAMWVGIADRREAGGLEMPEAPTPADFAGVGAPAPAIAPAIAPLLGGEVAREPNGAAAAAARRPATVAGRDPAGAGVDSLRLRDGTVRTGVVERVTPSGLVLRDPWSDTAAHLGFDSIVEWRTRPGERVPVGAIPGGPDAGGAAGDPATPAPPAAHGGPAAPVDAHDALPDGHPPIPPPNPAARAAGAGDLGHAALVAGLAGRYSVRRRVLDVAGSESCGEVAAIVRRSAPTVETVAHRPGEAEFALTSRPGLRGVVDDDGRFRTDVVTGARGGVHYRFRMVGQFLPDGWRAETESETRAVLRWGDVQRCRVSVALEASRLP